MRERAGTATWRVGVGVLGIVLGLEGRATAQGKPSEPVPASSAHGSAILRVSEETASGLGPSRGALVVASPIVSDLALFKGDELALRIAAQVAGKLGARVHGQPAALGLARGLSGRAASLIYLQLEIVKGELRVTADLYPVVSNGWERLRNPVPGPRAHAFAMAPLDAEIRAFMTPVLLEQASVHKVKHEEGEVLAIGCGDLDGDGGNELVLVTRQRVVVARIRGGKLVVERAATWAGIAPRVPVPLREALATVLVSPPGHPGEIHLGTTDRGGIVVDASLTARRPLTGLPIPGGAGRACAIASAETGAFEGSAVVCEPAAPTKNGKVPAALTAFTPPATRYDAVATLDNVGRDGSVAQVVVVREPSGKLRLRQQDVGVGTGKPSEATLEGAGAQVALADLDLDGTPEIVSSADGADDVVLVSSFARGVFTPRLRFPARDGVRALGVCPPEEKGVPGVIAVVGSEVWLVR